MLWTACTFLLFPLLITWVTAQYSPIKDVCDICACYEPHISCEDFDRNTIEDIIASIPKKFKKLTINGAKSLTRLEPRHLQNLRQLNYLKIVHSNLQSIDSKTFWAMNELQELDISFNKLSFIGPATFAGLNLSIFEMTDNKQLRLDPLTFQDLQAETINLKSNGIRTLDMMVFQQIKGLRKLLLYNNSIEELSSDVRTFFKPEDRFVDLTDNPLICKCELNWLALKVVPWSRENIRSDINITCKYLEKNQYGSRTGRSLTVELVKMVPDKLCSKTSIERVDIKLKEYGKIAVLTCTANSIANLDVFMTPVGHNFNPEQMLSVRPPIVTLMHLTDQKSTSKWSLKAEPSASIIRRSSVDLEIEVSPEDRNYTCEAKGENNVIETIVVNVKGFDLLTLITSQNSDSKVSFDSFETLDKTRFGLEDGSDIHFLFKKQFTLFEMIGGIMGTFILTLILLLICSRFYYITCQGKSRLRFAKSNSNGMLRDTKEVVSKDSAMITASTRTGGNSSTNSSGATISVNPQFMGVNYPVPPGTPGPQYGSHFVNQAPNSVPPVSLFQTLSPQQKHCLLNQQTPLLQNSLSHAALLAGYWPSGAAPPPGSPYSMNSHEYDVPRNTDFTPFDQMGIK